MNKQEFLEELRKRLNDYPEDETKASVEYYEEAIADRVEDGMTEGEAVASLGKIDEIVSQIKSELPIRTIVKQKTKGKKLPVWALVLIILGFPIWISILATLLSVYLSIWAIVASLWITDVAFAFAAVCSLVSGFLNLFHSLLGVFNMGCALVFAGISIVLGIGCFYASKGLVMGTVWCFKKIKRELTDTEVK